MAFLTDKAAKEKISALESQVSDLEANAKSQDETIERLQAELKTANENVLAANQERDQAKADLEAAKATIAANAEKVKAAEEQEATFADRVDAAVQVKFASLGGDQIDGGSEGNHPENKDPKTRALEKWGRKF